LREGTNPVRGERGRRVADQRSVGLIPPSFNLLSSSWHSGVLIGVAVEISRDNNPPGWARRKGLFGRRGFPCRKGHPGMSETIEARVRKVKAVIFDLDDTLVESKVDFPKFKRLVIEKIVSFGEDRDGYSMSETVVKTINRFEERQRQAGIPKAEIERRLSMLDKIMDEVEMERAGETEAYEGATRLLEELRRNGIKVGILTRGCQAYAAAVLQRTGLAELVDSVECRSSHVKAKPNPEAYIRLVNSLGVKLDETIFVGDHPIDATCAANAGVPFVAVMTGDVPEKALRDSGSVEVFRDVSDLADWFAKTLSD
jgi:phosphoglycolate phosphatase